jgi:hypothetical protein
MDFKVQAKIKQFSNNPQTKNGRLNLELRRPNSFASDFSRGSQVQGTDCAIVPERT